MNVNVWIVAKKKRLATGKIAVYRTLQWHAGGVTPSGKPKITSESMGRVTKGRAEELRKRKIAALASGEAPINRPGKITLGVFRDLYLQRRASADDSNRNGRHKTYPRLKLTTLREHRMALAYLVAKVGEQRQLATIEEADVEDFLEALAAGSLTNARKPGTKHYDLGEQSVRKHTRTLRAVWAWAQHHGMVAPNPFRAFHSRPLPTEPGHHVTLTELDALLEVAPSDGWRCMFALCRLAGLRRDEARTLPWSGRVRDHRGEYRTVGIDWDTKRLHIVSTKNQRYRVVPMVPGLESMLLESFGQAADGAGSITGLSPHNLTRKAQEFTRAAGLEPWPKFYQSMRVSRENDWKLAGFAEATYAKWLGHSVTVSRQHYVSPTESEFAAAADGV